MLRAGDILMVRWVDRLGRNYADVTEVIRQFMARGVVIKTVINGLTFDGATKDPMQKAVRDALIAFMAATAEAQAEATREAQKAGIAHVKATEPHRYRGRKPSFDRVQLDIILGLLAQDASPTAIAEAAAGCHGKSSTVWRTILRRRRQCSRSGDCEAQNVRSGGWSGD